jgi:accessory gene regulator B
MPISNILIYRILLKNIRDLNHYDEDDLDMIRYGLEAILWEIEKFIYLIIIFSFMGQGIPFLIILAILMSAKPFTGGLHVDSVWGCFFLTWLTFILALIILPYIVTINNNIIIITGIFSVTTTWLIAPVRTLKKERIAKKEKDPMYRILGTIITATWFIIFFFYQEHRLAAPSLWLLFIQNIQMIAVLWQRKMGK